MCLSALAGITGLFFFVPSSFKAGSRGRLQAPSQSPASPPLPAASLPGDAKPPTSAPETIEQRLKRMEESYRRMEESNRQIKLQYETLLEKFEILSSELSKTRATAPGPVDAQARQIKPISDATPSSATSALESLGTDELGVSLDPLEGTDVEEFIAPYFQPPGSGAQGRIRRSAPLSGIRADQLPGAESRMDQIGAGAEGTGGRTFPDQQPDVGDYPFGRSRMDRIGGGADGTGGRVSPEQQPSGTGARGAIRRQLQQVEGIDQGPASRPAKVAFGEGLEFTSDDGEFRLQFHNLTQAEYRGFPARDQGVLQSQFFVPRERWYFTGDLTKYVGFYTVINRSYGSLDVLDAFISLRLDDRLGLRIGRMKTPYLYEYFSIAEGDLFAPNDHSSGQTWR